MGEVLNIRKLDIGYGRESIVADINFNLNKGELCGIIGVNGIGKSTLLRTLANLQPKISGSIAIGQKELSSLSNEALAKNLSVVLTDPIATRNLTVFELIALGRQPYTNWIGKLSPHDRDKIHEYIQLFDLASMVKKKCYELSDGQLQRVLIARAMAQDTPVILLDEPTTHLDLFHKVRILKLLQRLAHDFGKTILFTSHEIELAIQLCDNILILDGKQNPFGSPKELIEKGCFGSLFPEDVIQFDSRTGAFKITK